MYIGNSGTRPVNIDLLGLLMWPRTGFGLVRSHIGTLERILLENLPKILKSCLSFDEIFITLPTRLPTCSATNSATYSPAKHDTELDTTPYRTLSMVPFMASSMVPYEAPYIVNNSFK